MKPSEVLALVCDELEIAPINLTGKRRFRCISDARWIVSAIWRNHYGMTLEEIAARLKKDHGSICHGIKRVREAAKYDSALSRKIERVEKRLREI